MGRKKKIKIGLVLVLLIAILGFSYSYYEANNIKLREYTFKHKDIPLAFDGKKLVFITDIHCNRYLPPSVVKKIVTTVNQLNGDILFLGGDNTEKDSIYSKGFFEAIKGLNAQFGKYSVLGNHDYWEDADLIQEGLINSGFNICDNQSYWIYEGSDSIKIGGVGDLWEDQQLIENTVWDVDKSDFCILLSHNPDYIEYLDSDKVDLMLSGHNHGGQVTIFGLHAPIMPSYWRSELPTTGQKYRYGWKSKGDTQLYVSTGIGVGDFPFRFFAQPEIVKITLERIE